MKHIPLKNHKTGSESHGVIASQTATWRTKANNKPLVVKRVKS